MDFKEFQKSWQPFDAYEITIKVPRLAGGIPKTKDMIRGWVDATNKEKSAEDRQKIVDATGEEIGEASGNMEENKSIGFKSEDGKLYIEGRQVKAMLKEAANILRNVAPGGKEKDKGISALKSKVADHVFVLQEQIFMGRDKPDEIEERVIHVMTRQGPRDSLKRVEYVRDVTLEFTIRRLRDNAVPETALYAILDYAQEIGLGADRSQGVGKFKIVSVNKI
jgi:hypothetical protein